MTSCRCPGWNRPHPRRLRLAFFAMRSRRTVLGIWLLLCMSGPFVRGEFAGGDGGTNTPYLVATAEHLDNVRNYPTVHFRQTADIDLNEAPWNEGQGWVPIGNNSTRFSGVYDGGNHRVTGLFIDRSTSDFQGNHHGESVFDRNGTSSGRRTRPFGESFPANRASRSGGVYQLDPDRNGRGTVYRYLQRPIEQHREFDDRPAG